MASVTDNTGRIWDVPITRTWISALYLDTEFDLDLRGEDAPEQLIQFFRRDAAKKRVLSMALLWSLFEKQAVQRGVPPHLLGELFSGEQMFAALLSGISQATGKSFENRAIDELRIAPAG